MAAASLRHAARRLGGRALQRPRFTTQLQSLTAEGRKGAVGVFAEIKTRKEELYDLIARCERKYVVGGSTGSENGELLEHLSRQVKPRPDDPHWRSCHQVATFNHYMSRAAPYCVGFTIAQMFMYLGKLYPGGKESLGNQQEQLIRSIYCLADNQG